MTNPRRIVAPFIRPEDIDRIVKGLRAKFPVCAEIPVDILVFAEHDLQLEFQFKPIAQFGQDAFLLHDFSGIVFDDKAFEKRNENRLRFSVAHELGHLYLHRDLYNVQFKSIQQWVDFVDEIPAEQYQWIEWQADEFAGQLLMPSDNLKSALDEVMKDAEREGYLPQGEEAVFEFCCRGMHRDFGVSRQAIQTRLRRAKLWPHPGLK